uniref:coiled-coil domain-containing protein 136 n=1 Tax=Euleptes europaea TaxID=460621 RepID=UPI002540FE20|nr:coiled-coil domain-containing protein 136 [Euleptes europaea]
MEAAGMQLPGRRKERAGEGDSPNLELNGEEEEEEEEEEEQLRSPGSLDEDEKESDQEMDELRAQVLQLLEELEEAREMVLKQEEDSLQLQGLLEDERLASAQQAEIFTKQIQRLQAQLHSMKDEFDSMQEGKDVELDRLEQELREANEEIHSLRLDAEEAAALHENEIAGLQEELCRMKAELEQVQNIRNEYDLEITSLRAEIDMKEPGTGDSQPSPELSVVTHYDNQTAAPSENVTRLQEELQCLRTQYQELSDEYQILQESNKIMVHQLEKLESMKYRSRSKLDDSPSFESDSEENIERYYFNSKRTSLQGPGSVSFKSVEVVGFASEYEYDRMSRLDEEEDVSDMQLQLKTEEQKVETVKAQCNQAKDNLREMESMYEVSRQEWERLQEELRLCKEEIERLNGTIPVVGGRAPHAPDPPMISLPLIGLVVIVALLWCWWAETSS